VWVIKVNYCKHCYSPFFTGELDQDLIDIQSKL
jgi:hypothetical protein